MFRQTMRKLTDDNNTIRTTRHNKTTRNIWGKGIKREKKGENSVLP